MKRCLVVFLFSFAWSLLVAQQTASTNAFETIEEPLFQASINTEASTAVARVIDGRPFIGVADGEVEGVIEQSFVLGSRVHFAELRVNIGLEPTGLPGRGSIEISFSSNGLDWVSAFTAQTPVGKATEAIKSIKVPRELLVDESGAFLVTDTLHIRTSIVLPAGAPESSIRFALDERTRFKAFWFFTEDHTQQLIVTSAADQTGEPGTLTLREAISQALATETTLITFAPELSGVTVPMASQITIASRTLRIDGSSLADPVTIIASSSRHFEVKNSGYLTLRNINLNGGFTGAGLSGGSMLVQGGLNTDGVIISNPRAGYFGGGICAESSGRVEFRNSTIDGGSAAAGAAFCNRGNYALLWNCVIKNSTTTGWGSAVSNDYGSKTEIYGGILSNNDGEFGGAFENYDIALVVNSRFENNTSDYSGGAYYSSGVSDWVVDSEFIGNEADWEGGAIRSYSNQFTVERSYFSGNSADDGGAIRTSDDFDVVDCWFDQNSASNGGALYSLSGKMSAIRSTFSGNTATFGGAAYLWADFEAINSTFSGNFASSSGGAIYGRYGEDVDLRHCLIIDNESNSVGGFYGNSGSRLFNTVVAGNVARTDPNLSGRVLNLFGNSLSGGPFPSVLPLGDYGGYVPTHHPVVNSGFIDPAASGSETEGVSVDQRGSARVVNGIVDSGPVEVDPSKPAAFFAPADGISDLSLLGAALRWYFLPEAEAWEVFIDTDRNDLNDRLEEGDEVARLTSEGVYRMSGLLPETEYFWAIVADLGGERVQSPVFSFTTRSGFIVESAADETGGLFTTLRDAIEQAQDGDVILFDAEAMGSTEIILTQQLVLNNDVAIDASALEVDGRPALIIRGNGSRLFQINGSSRAAIKSVILTGGGTADSGGAILVNGGSLDIENVEFRDNRASGSGGAIASTGFLTALDCSFLDNRANGSGGAIQVGGGNTLASLEGVVFRNNQANNGGALSLLNSASLTLLGAGFHSNIASGAGGALYLSSTGDAYIEQSVFGSNTAGSHGGAIDLLSTKTYVSNSTFGFNEAGQNGGAIRQLQQGRLTLENTTIHRNRSGGSGGGLLSEANLTLFDSVIQGNVAFQSANVSFLNATSVGVNFVEGDGAFLEVFDEAGDLGWFTPVSNSEVVDPDGGETDPENLTSGTDQRDAQRLYIGADDTSGVMDSGAVEFDPTLDADVLLPAPDATGVGLFQEALEWTFAPGATEYEVWTGVAGAPLRSVGTTQIGRWVIDELFPETSYSWKIVARWLDADGEVLSEIESPIQSFTTRSAIRVTSVLDNNPGNATSLREAIVQAAETPGGDSIIFSFAPGDTEIQLGNNSLIIDSNVIINGRLAGDAVVSVLAGNNRRVALVLPGRSARFRNLRLSGGNAVVDDGVDGLNGGLIRGRNASLSLYDCVLEDGTATGQGGAVSVSDGSLLVSGSTVRGAAATLDGGAIHAEKSSVHIVNSTLHGNGSRATGGAIAAFDTSDVTVDQSTVYGNLAQEGGAFALQGVSSLKLLQSTVFRNKALVRGGALRGVDNASTAEIERSVIADNVSPVGADFSIQESSLSRVGANFTGNDPLLSGLGNFGGQQPTVVPLSGSDLVDQVAEADRQFDQRGLPRLVGGGLDLGATESQGSDVFYPIAGQTDLPGFDLRLGWRFQENADSYSVYFGKTGQSLAQIGSTTTASFSVPFLEPLTSYQWRVDAQVGESLIQGPTLSFTTSASIVVTTLIDEDNGSINPLSGTGVSLREAVAHAETTIEDELITFASALGTRTLLLNEPILVDDTVIIDGTTVAGDIAISGQGIYQLFQVRSQGNLVLRALTLQDAGVDIVDEDQTEGILEGGAILVEGGRLQMVDVLARRCFARLNGGVVANRDGDVSIISSVFTGSASRFGAGGAFAQLGSSSTLNLSNVTFRDNNGGDGSSVRAARDGGAVYIGDGDAVISDCLFEGNRSQFGGGLYVGGGDVVVEGGLFDGNESLEDGGALLASESLRLRRVEFANNYSGGSGGALLVSNGLEFDGVYFHDNRAEDDGGATAFAGGLVDGINGTWLDNTSGNAGGGVSVDGASVTLRNATLSGNSARFGGAIDAAGPQLTLVHVTVAGNNASAGAGGIESATQRFELFNSVVANNPGNGSGSNVIGTLTDSGGNVIGVDPGLEAPAFFGGFGPTMQPSLIESTVVNEGVPNLALAPSRDQRGVLRPSDAPDAGAVEFSEVNLVTTTANDGDDSLRLAIQAAFDANTGVGLIQIDNSLDGQTITLESPITIGRSIRIFAEGLTQGVTIAGTGGGRLFEVSPGAVLSISSLPLDDGSGGEPITLSGGRSSRGGAIHNNAGELSLQNIVLRDNAAVGATADGGAIYSSGTAFLRNCWFDENEASRSGGGVYVSSNSAVLVDQCRFDGNLADPEGDSSGGFGGALALSLNSTATVVDSHFETNDAWNEGGGIYVRGDVEIEGCSFVSNIAFEGGGIFFDTDAAGSLRHSTIFGNYVFDNGGGVYEDSGDVEIANCTIVSNRAELRAGGLFSGIDPNVVYSILSGNTAGSLEDFNWEPAEPDLNILGEDPFLGALGYYGGLESLTASMPLLPGSPAIDPANSPQAEGALDQLGRERTGAVDFGAVEFDEAIRIPADGASGVAPFQLEFGWAEPAVDGGGYLFELGTSPGQLMRFEVSEPRIVIEQLDPDTLYYWRVTPIGSEQSGLVTQFTTRPAIVVGSTDDLEEGTSLRAAIESAESAYGGDIIQFAPGLSGAVIELNSSLDIEQAVWIDASDLAENPTLDGGGTDRHFDVYPGAVLNLSGLTLVNGDSGDEDGGAILATAARVILESVTIDGCEGDNGAALSLDLSDLRATDTTFTNNDAARDGGAIYAIDSSVNLADVVFSGNDARDDGGAVWQLNGAFYLIRGVVTGNTADAGAGLYLDTDDVWIIDTTISGNGAGRSGGGLSVASTATVRVVNSSFSDNSAISDGGGIFAARASLVVLEGSLIEGGQADRGAGIFSEGGEIQFVQTLANGPEGDHDYLVGTTHRETLLVNSTEPFGEGSLFDVVSNAPEGALIQFAQSLSGRTLRVLSTMVVSRPLSIDGSGLAERITLNGSGSRLFDLVAPESGSAAVLVLRDLNLERAGAESDEFGVSGAGGAIRVNANTRVELYDVIVRENYASSYGAGLFVDADGEALVEDCYFHNNDGVNAQIQLDPISLARNNGGAIATFGELLVRETTLSGNIGVLGGGLFVGEGGIALLENTSIGQNGVSISGGGIHHEGDSLELSHVTVAQNESRLSHGGVFVEDGSDIILRNSIVGGNISAESPSTTDLSEAGLGGVEDGNLIGDPAAVAPLDFYGETVPVMPPLLHSAAIGSAVPGLLATDQRTTPRGSSADAGAVERFPLVGLAGNDVDGDSVPDFLESKFNVDGFIVRQGILGFVFGEDDSVRDRDLDGIPDWLELALGTRLADPLSSPRIASVSRRGDGELGMRVEFPALEVGSYRLIIRDSLPGGDSVFQSDWLQPGFDGTASFEIDFEPADPDVPAVLFFEIEVDAEFGNDL